MIYGWHVNYEHAHYHFYSPFGHGSAEKEPLPSVSIYHLCSVLRIRENISCIPNSEDEPSTVPGPFDFIGHTGFQLFFLRPCLADNPGQRLVKRRSWGLPVLSRLG